MGLELESLHNRAGRADRAGVPSQPSWGCTGPTDYSWSWSPFTTPKTNPSSVSGCLDTLELDNTRLSDNDNDNTGCRTPSTTTSVVRQPPSAIRQHPIGCSTTPLSDIGYPPSAARQPPIGYPPSAARQPPTSATPHRLLDTPTNSPIGCRLTASVAQGFARLTASAVGHPGKLFLRRQHRLLDTPESLTTKPFILQQHPLSENNTCCPPGPLSVSGYPQQNRPPETLLKKSTMAAPAAYSMSSARRAALVERAACRGELTEWGEMAGPRWGDGIYRRWQGVQGGLLSGVDRGEVRFFQKATQYESAGTPSEDEEVGATTQWREVGGRQVGAPTWWRGCWWGSRKTHHRTPRTTLS